MISQHNPVHRDLLKTLSELVEKYNQYLETTQGSDQLGIHKDLQKIIDKLDAHLPG